MKGWKILFPLILCAFAVGGTIAAKKYHRPLKFDECSEAYQRYAEMDGVEVTYIKDRKINDSIQLDMTVIIPTDSSAWRQLIMEFFEASVDVFGYDSLIASKRTIFRGYNWRKLPTTDGEEAMVCDVIAGNMKESRIIICHCNDTVATTAGFDYLFELLVYIPKQ